MAKDNLHLNFSGNRTFLNFWNWFNGDDVVCELKGEKLFLHCYDENGDQLPDKEITIGDFCQLVKTKLKHIDEHNKPQKL